MRWRAVTAFAVAWLLGASPAFGASVVAPDDALFATRVQLAAPLTTLVALPAVRVADGIAIDFEVTVPEGPAEVGIGAFLSDAHGQWFQCLHPQPLHAGTNHIALRLDPLRPLGSHPWVRSWTPAMAALADRAGLFVFSAGVGGGLEISGRLHALPPAPESSPRLLDCAAPATGRTGERWQFDCVPSPFPRNPFDPDEFALDAHISLPDGSEQVVPGFWWEPMRSTDRGDREDVVPDGHGRFSVRYRPSAPGSYRIRLIARWRGRAAVECAALALEVAGEPWDDIVRVDRSDPRFFSRGGRWYWPIGLNLRSPNDLRSHDNLHTAVTPDRGTYSYHAYLERFARSGGTATEVWMAPWSLGLEWNSSWFGFHGLGRYSQSNAWRLEHVLDDALDHGVRINLVISNHGQASSDSDPEWQGSPYNAANGGPVAHSPELFTDPRALALQQRYRRYLAARYADHPGVMGWKLWSEVNLTPIGANSVAWHRQAADRWHALDVYRHPVTTHWADDYRSAELAVVSLPQLDFACIDAYYRRDILADVLMNSTLNPARGLARFGKPILVSEYGGREFGAPSAQLAAELACSGFASLVSGHAGMPMLWWWEWVDQGDRWAPYGAIARFIDGEDIRGIRAGSAKLYAIAAGRDLWCHAWRRQGRMLGYVLDPDWVKDGVREDDLSQGRLQAGAVETGGMTIEWWDADRGERLSSEHVDHLGGALTLPMPTFRRHLAFKLIRDPAPGP